MLDEFKEMLNSAAKDYEKDRNLPRNKALREIIALEKANYYNKNISSSRLKDIKNIISGYVDKEA